MVKKNEINTTEDLGNEEFENKYVHETYNVIAKKFSGTRHSTWPRVSHFIQTELSSAGLLIADIGCGNGKYLVDIPHNCRYIGVDACENLLAEAQKINTKLCKNAEFTKGNILNIPIGTNAADCCICIATLHHLSSRTRRMATMKELVRITKHNCKILIYVWAMEQKENSIGARSFSQPDNFVDWRDNEKNLVGKRYYHIYSKEEFQADIEEALHDLVELIDLSYDSNNWAAILKKM